MSTSSPVFSWAYTNLLHTKRVFDRINSNFESAIIVSIFIAIYLAGVHRTKVAYIVLLLARNSTKRRPAVRISIIGPYVQLNKGLRTPTLEKNVLNYVVLYDWLTYCTKPSNVLYKSQWLGAYGPLCQTSIKPHDAWCPVNANKNIYFFLVFWKHKSKILVW